MKRFDAMDDHTPDELQKNVLAQAHFRLTFGMLVALVISIIYFTSYKMEASAAGAIALVALYGVYATSMRIFAQRRKPLDLREQVVVSAVLDPLFLSAWLLFAGDTSVIFVGFYLFTVLGFGFRIGAKAMHICQAMSLLGFAIVAFVSPTWREQILFAISYMIILLVVPVYASFLIQRIQTAKALAEHESRAKSQLLAKVSHELRTPLTGITASAQLLEVESSEAETVRRSKAILQLAGTLEAEIDQLLELSKFETQGRKRREPAKSFSLAYAATRAFKSLESIAAGKSLKVSLEFDENIKSPVIGHYQELLAVLTNLFGNAVKFTEHGSVTLKMRLIEQTASGYRVRVAVEDTGIGVAPEHHEKIFEPFYQVADGRSPTQPGTGLGSAIARELVMGMGGDLKVDSALGEGSVFWFELTFPIDHRAVPAEPDARAQRGALVSNKRVLIADDNTTNLELMREMLLKGGHEVMAVSSGQEAILQLSSREFDILFLDYNIDDVDGATVFQTYQFSRINIAPTFFVTADTTSRTTQLLEDLGAAGVIHKPMTFEKIREAFASAFPGEAVVPVGAAVPAAPKKLAELSSVPVEYLDYDKIGWLREIKDTPEFLFSVISDALADIKALDIELGGAIESCNLPQLHRSAHSMKGVSLSVGCMRLAGLADRMMGLTNDALVSDPARWQTELQNTLKNTVEALEEVRQGFAPPHAVNN
ncbi:response regulator [Luteimonas sp. SJ-92]|uniref:histidine kinase n=1 Tax=Luteimonas salinisoli TaxID=2752307 RepID=A0A853JGM3_9GAMM|nr:sensor histidine kinase [Luteimonas salinisoli]NZA27620.1 response regulator [Luteimonas salinisoli]